MNVNSLFFQIVMAGLAIGIVILYIQPTFVRIGEIQDAIDQYKDERLKVSEVNNKLTNLINKVNEISANDQRNLLVYMPNEVDNISVSRDIYNIALMSGVDLLDISYAENKKNNNEIDGEDEKTTNETLPVPHVFSVNVTGSYENIKTFLGSLEQSNYPLEVHKLQITSSALEELSASIEIVTYSHL